MKWRIRAATHAALTDDQAETLTARGAVVTYNSDTHLVELLYDIDADDMFAANELALAKLTDLSSHAGLPYATQLLIRAEGHYGGGVPLVSTQSIAGELDVSATAVRQFKANELEFPEPIQIPGIAADLYDADEVAAYVAARKFGVRVLGRPRQGDEELLTDALAMLTLREPIADFVYQSMLQRAINATGGRYVRGKAKVLLDLLKRPHLLEVVPDLPRFAEAVERAHEMWDD